MNVFRIAMQCAVLGLVGLSAVTAQGAAGGGGRSALTEITSTIEDLDGLDPPYKAYTGIDYGPLQVPPPKTKITNVTGVFVETPLECAVRCNDEKLCNAASFYGENPVGSWPAGGLTCWLKTITVPCEVPPDYQASEYPDTIFLLAQDEDYCEVEKPRPLLAILAGRPSAADSPTTVAEEDVFLLAPQEGDPMVAPLEAGPVVAPAAVSLAAEPPAAAVAPPVAAAPPPPTPPVPTPPVRGDLISDFEIDVAPGAGGGGGVGGSSSNAPDPPPSPPAQSALNDTDEPDLAAGPDGAESPVDTFPEQGTLTVGRGASSAAGLHAAMATAAGTAAATAFLMAR